MANITFMLNYAFLTELPFEALSLEFVNEGKYSAARLLGQHLDLITDLIGYGDTGYIDNPFTITVLVPKSVTVR